MSFFTQLNHKIGLDVGTSRIRIFKEGEGVVLDQPSCLAVDQNNGKVIAVGSSAAEMQGRVGGNVAVYWPLEQGLVSDKQLTHAMLSVFLQKIIPQSIFFRSTMVVSQPLCAGEIDRSAISEVLYSLGAKEVLIIAQPVAAAIGAGVPIADASGSFIVQCGAGIIEGSVISLGGVVVGQSSIYAGAYLDQRIIDLIRKNNSLLISREVAEQAKIKIASVSGKKASLLITGQDLETSAPKEMEIHSQVFLPLLSRQVEDYIELMKQVLEKIPPELTADIIDKGVLLSGGLARLHGFDDTIINALGVNASVIEESDLAVIKGLGVALEHIDLFKESLGYTN